MNLIKYLQLPVHVPLAAIQADTAALAAQYWQAHYNQKHYEGDWNILSLRAMGGDWRNNYSVHAGAAGVQAYADTEMLQQCPSVRKFMDALPCEKMSVRLMRLGAGARIKTHCDHDLSFEQGEIRLHVPVFTNEQVFFYLEEERVVMEEGTCWYLNLQLPHRVDNEGAKDRIHLVIDCLVNDWIQEQFHRSDLPVKKVAKEKPASYSAGQLESIINELRMRNTAADQALIRTLEAELKNTKPV